MSIVRKTEPTLQCGRNHLVKFGPLHPATKLLLQRFFAPWNDELRRLLEAKGVATVPGYGFTPGEENKERSDVAIYERFSCELFLNYRRKKMDQLQPCSIFVFSHFNFMPSFLIFFPSLLLLLFFFLFSSTRCQPNPAPKGRNRQKSAPATGSRARPAGRSGEGQRHHRVLVVALRRA